MSFDHLNLAKDDKVRKILQKHADGIYDEIILYSNYVTKINRKSKSQQRILIITNAACYNFTPGAVKSRSFSIRNLFESGEHKNDFQPPQVTKSKTMPHSKTASMTKLTGCSVGQLKRRIAIKNIHTISLSAIVHEVVLHVPNEYDYLYRVAQKKDVEHIVRILGESAGNLSPSHHIKCWIFELNNLGQISENNKARNKKNETQEQYMQKKVNDWNKKYKMKKYEPKTLQTITKGNKNKKGPGHIKAHSTMSQMKHNNHRNNQPQRNINKFGPSPTGHSTRPPQYFNNYPQRPLTPNFNQKQGSNNPNQQHSFYTPPPNQQANNMQGFPDTKGMQFKFPPPSDQPPSNAQNVPAHRQVFSENFANNAQYQNQMAIMYQQQGSRTNLNQSMTNLAAMQYQNNPQQQQGYNQYNNNNNNNNNPQYNHQQQKTKKEEKEKKKGDGKEEKNREFIE